MKELERCLELKRLTLETAPAHIYITVIIVMPTNQVNELGDFRASTIGAQSLGGRSPRKEGQGLIGFLYSREILHQNYAVTKRPPLYFISRTPHNASAFFIPIASPRHSQRTLIGIDKKPFAISIVDGVEIATSNVVAKILTITEVNGNIIVTTDSVLVSGPGGSQIVAAFYGSLQLELYEFRTFGSVTHTYQLTPFTGEKAMGLTTFNTLRQVTTSALTDDVVPFVDAAYSEKINYFFTGSTKPTYAVDDHGVVTNPGVPYQADTATFFNNRLILGKTVNNSLTLVYSDQGSFTITTSSATSVLSQAYGSIFKWIKGNNKKLYLATDKGVFVADYEKFDSTTISELTAYDEHTSNTAKPVSFRNFLIFADSNGDNLSFIWYDYYNADLTVGFLNNDTSILGGEKIKKLTSSFFNTSNVFLILTESGKLFIGCAAVSRDNSLTLSYSQWCPDYKVWDVEVFRRENDYDRVMLAVEVGGYNFFCSLLPQAAPSFQDTTKPFPCLDFYREYDTNLMYPTRVPIFVSIPDSNNPRVVALETFSDYFRDDFVDVRIRSSQISIIVSMVGSARLATGYLLSDELYIDGTFVIQPQDFQIEVSSLRGVNHLVGLGLHDPARHEYQYCNADGNEGELRADLHTGLSFSASYSSFFRVGRLYYMILVTMPPSLVGSIHLYQSDLKISIENVGWHQPTMYVGDGQSLLLAGPSSCGATKQLIFGDTYDVRHYIRVVEFGFPGSIDTSPLISIWSKSQTAPYISTLGVRFNISES